MLVSFALLASGSVIYVVSFVIAEIGTDDDFLSPYATAALGTSSLAFAGYWLWRAYQGARWVCYLAAYQAAIMPLIALQSGAALHWVAAAMCVAGGLLLFSPGTRRWYAIRRADLAEVSGDA